LLKQNPGRASVFEELIHATQYRNGENVLDVFKIGDMLSVTLDGKCEMLKNGTKLYDKSGRTYEVVSVAMTRYNDPSDIAKSTTVLLKACDIETGSELFIA